jgi:hypothetical protein
MYTNMEALFNLYGQVTSSVAVPTMQASVTLTSPYTSGGTSIDVSSIPSGFPTSGTCSLTILNPETGEVYGIFRVTLPASGLTFTGVVEGAAFSAPTGAAVVGTMLTAAAITQIKTDAGGGGSVVALAPYISIGGTLYVPQTLYPATLPPASPTWINAVPPTAVISAPNGNLVLSQTVAFTCFLEVTAAVSVEAVARVLSQDDSDDNYFDHFGVWLWDSTNSLIYSFCTQQGNGYPSQLILNVFNYSGSGNPTFNEGLDQWFGLLGDPLHFKLIVSGGVLSCEISLDGGQTYTTMFTASGIGTISKGGISVSNLGDPGNTVVNLLSLKAV